MANKPNTATTPAGTPAIAEPTQETSNGTQADFDWAAMEAPVVMPTKAVVTAVAANVLETVPEQIRKRAEASLKLNTDAKNAKANSTAKRARVIYHWDFQTVRNEHMAAAFDRLITKYAKYRPAIDDVPFADPASPKGQVTARTGNPGHFVRTDEGEFVSCAATTEGAVYGLRYSVRPFEQRGNTARLPGTA